MQLNFKRQAGATLMEIIMVVALIAVITIGALTYFNSASESSKVQESVASLTGISAVVRNQFQSQGDYNGLTESLLFRSTNIPVSVKSTVNVDQLRHPWSQTAASVLVAPAGSPFATFTITFAELPRGACVEITSKVYKSFESMTVNGTSVTPATGAATASLSCTDTNTNVLTFTQS
jgi:Tfp pilus assembly protein PilE